MKNDKYYKDVFDEIHVPEAVLGKVRDMKMEKKEIRCKSKLRYAVSIAAAFVLCMVVSNGIAYAATGSTWISKATWYINGEKTEKDVVWHQDGDNFYGEISVENDDEVKVEHISGTSPDSTIDTGNDSVVELILETDSDKVFLNVGNGLKRIDITDDFADGECKGTVELDGASYNYEITGTVDEYSIILN